MLYAKNLALVFGRLWQGTDKSQNRLDKWPHDKT